jgi:hypothetical protein
MFECRDCNQAFGMVDIIPLKSGDFICASCYGNSALKRQSDGKHPEKIKRLSQVDRDAIQKKNQARLEIRARFPEEAVFLELEEFDDLINNGIDEDIGEILDNLKPESEDHLTDDEIFF